MMCGPIVFLLLAFICTFSEGKSCTGQIIPQKLMADNTVKSCMKRRGKCCSVSEDGDHVTWDGGADYYGSCDLCWTGKSIMDISESLGWLVEKFFDKLLHVACEKMWDSMWKDWSGTKKPDTVDTRHAYTGSGFQPQEPVPHRTN